jgi:hypothetical protein
MCTNHVPLGGTGQFPQGCPGPIHIFFDDSGLAEKVKLGIRRGLEIREWIPFDSAEAAAASGISTTGGGHLSDERAYGESSAL